MKHLSSYIISVADFTAELPFSYVNTDFEKLGLWFLIAFGFLLAAMTAIISAGIFLLSFSANFYTSLGKCKITLYGESKGSCAVVSLNGKGVLIGFEGDIYDEKEIIMGIILALCFCHSVKHWRNGICFAGAGYFR